ncbi:MAG: curli production assembly/transport component CsgF [Parcubacteria group bacterium Athens0714_26]|nr:MAG: curli production assembly/transport component CsgF [Parcubacteria group bacterium Athens1014_26]TSD01236.1 MAG: curli production assembly/transport component CsgF [Parcubacteria group bacterium Athens0714_26]
MKAKNLFIIQLVVIVIVLLLVFFLNRKTYGSELLYQPINPSFGGSPLNGSFLLNSAQVQNDLEAKKQSAPRDPMTDFKNSLTRQILNRLSQQIIESAFGEEELKPGEYNVGDYSVVVTNDGSGVTVTITDTTTDNSTTVTVPYY